MAPIRLPQTQAEAYAELDIHFHLKALFTLITIFLALWVVWMGTGPLDRWIERKRRERPFLVTSCQLSIHFTLLHLPDGTCKVSLGKVARNPSQTRSRVLVFSKS
jgi:hypothetical protein